MHRTVVKTALEDFCRHLKRLHLPMQTCRLLGKKVRTMDEWTTLLERSRRTPTNKGDSKQCRLARC